jgi:hypothetical protein
VTKVVQAIYWMPANNTCKMYIEHSDMATIARLDASET